MRNLAISTLVSVISILGVGAAWAQLPQDSSAKELPKQVASSATATPAKQNSWSFTSRRGNFPDGWYFISIKNDGGKWVINSFDRSPTWGDIHRESTIEPFLVSPDFQQWINYYTDRIGNCDSFSVQNSMEKNVCFSQFARKTSPGKSMLRVMFGGVGGIMYEYEPDLVNAAINSIDPAEALRWIEKVEARR